MRFGSCFAVGIVLMGAGSGLAREPESFTKAIRALEKSKTGHLLLSQAKSKWKWASAREFISILKWGPVSKTDAVLTRHFDPETGEEKHEREVIIYIKELAGFHEVVLDMAHELTHAVEGPSWDPYDPGLTSGRFVLSSLEGRGGEVEALTVECQVAMDLASSNVFPKKIAHERCGRYLDLSGTRVLREKVKMDFYLLGAWKTLVEKALGDEKELFPFFSSDQPRLLSSTGNAPYPVALMDEFKDLNQVACQNMRSRLEGSRAPAGDTLQKTLQFIKSRCEN